MKNSYRLADLSVLTKSRRRATSSPAAFRSTPSSVDQALNYQGVFTNGLGVGM